MPPGGDASAFMVIFGKLGPPSKIWDINHGTPSVEDLAADVIGAALGSVVVTIPLKRKRNK